MDIDMEGKAETCGLYYKPIMIVNDDSSIVNKPDTSLIDNTRVIIYNCHMFIVQTTQSLAVTKLLE
jgi:hypothetical protein